MSPSSSSSSPLWGREVRVPCLGRGATFTLQRDQDLLGEIVSRFPALRSSRIPFSIYTQGKKLREHGDDGAAPLEVIPGLPGGKGGFGSMLRALGAQIEKTTNKDACRDLSGRRLRDINEEERLKNYVSRQAEREQKEAEKKEAKLHKLKRIANGENKHEFKDAKYNQERESATERVHDAMEHAFKVHRKEDQDKAAATATTQQEEPKAGTSGTKRKAPAAATKSEPPAKSKKGLWMGVDLTESDLESSSDEDD